jgi:hypothetical protein
LLLLLYYNRKSAFCSLQPQSSSFQPSALCLCRLDCFLPSPAQSTARRLVFDVSLHRIASCLRLLFCLFALSPSSLPSTSTFLTAFPLLWPGRVCWGSCVEPLFCSLHSLRRVLSLLVVWRQEPLTNPLASFPSTLPLRLPPSFSTTLSILLLPLCTSLLPSLVIRRGRVVSTKTSLDSTLLPLTSTALPRYYLCSSTSFT